jgi:hypothetical protein
MQTKGSYGRGGSFACPPTASACRQKEDFGMGPHTPTKIDCWAAYLNLLLYELFDSLRCLKTARVGLIEGSRRRGAAIKLYLPIGKDIEPIDMF